MNIMSLWVINTMNPILSTLLVIGEYRNSLVYNRLGFVITYFLLRWFCMKPVIFFYHFFISVLVFCEHAFRLTEILVTDCRPVQVLNMKVAAAYCY